MPRLREPIDFNAVDGQPVDLVCLLLLPKENEKAQLNALAGVARRLRRPEVLEELRHAPNRVVLYNVMIGRTGRYQSPVMQSLSAWKMRSNIPDRSGAGDAWHGLPRASEDRISACNASLGSSATSDLYAGDRFFL
jgi:Phosphoenolpyruvate-dependent sugar phosphotransferase system, EIIA 2